MNRRWLAALLLLCASSLGAAAQGNVIERQITAAPGQDVRVGVYSDIRPDCTAGPLPAIKLLGPPAHGIVSVKRGTLKATNFKQCLGIELPVFIAFYHANGNYNGTDEFALEITFPGGRNQIQHIRVNVSSNAGKASSPAPI